MHLLLALHIIATATLARLTAGVPVVGGASLYPRRKAWLDRFLEHEQAELEAYWDDDYEDPDQWDSDICGDTCVSLIARVSPVWASNIAALPSSAQPHLGLRSTPHQEG